MTSHLFRYLPSWLYFASSWVQPTRPSPFTLLRRPFVTRNLYQAADSRPPGGNEALLRLRLRSGWTHPSVQEGGSSRHSGAVPRGLPSDLQEAPSYFIRKRTSEPETHSKASGHCPFSHLLAAWNDPWWLCWILRSAGKELLTSDRFFHCSACTNIKSLSCLLGKKVE